MAKKNRNNLSFVGENIKKIRQAKKLSQADVSKLFDLARASVGAYEEGRSEPKIETLVAMANYFGISVDALLTRKLTIAEIFKFNRVNEKLDKVHQLKGKGATKNLAVKLVRSDQYLDFLVQHTNNDFIDSMDDVGSPGSHMKADIAIEMNGGEMALEDRGVHHGDVLFGREIAVKDLKKKMGQIVVCATDSLFTISRLKAVERKMAILVPDNNSYPERELGLEEINVCWQIIGIYTSKMPKPMQMEDRLLRIEEELMKLKKD